MGYYSEFMYRSLMNIQTHGDARKFGENISFALRPVDQLSAKSQGTFVHRCSSTNMIFIQICCNKIYI